jgi:hypothetical protein
LTTPYCGKDEDLKAKRIKQSNENHPCAKPIYIYNYDTKELLFNSNVTKEGENWLVENGFVNKNGGAYYAIQTYRDSEKSYSANKKPNIKLLFSTNKLLQDKIREIRYKG